MKVHVCRGSLATAAGGGKGSKALSEITSNRQCIYAQRIATIFQTGEHGSPLQYNNNIVPFIKSDLI